MSELEERKQKALKESIEKWENIIENFYHLEYIGDIIFDQCGFCKDTRKISGQSTHISVSGRQCSKYCLINRDICGSSESLMSEIYNLIYRQIDDDYYDEDEDEDEIFDLCVKVLESLKTNPFKP